MSHDEAISLPLANEQQRLQTTLQAVVREAQALGASQAAAAASVTQGFSLNVRMGEVETLEYHRDNGLSVTVYFGQSKGSASTSDMRSQAISEAVRAACDIAKVTSSDPCAGLADYAQMAWDFPQLALFYPWSLTPKAGIEAAIACERTALDVDKQLTNSEGVSVHTQQSLSGYANSHGFEGLIPTTYHSISCSLLGEEADSKQRDFDYSSARDARDLCSWEVIARSAARRTLQRLGARPIKTCQGPVIFAAPIASSLLRSFVAACSGGNLYRKASFLLDALGKSVFASHLHIYQRPHLTKGLGSTAYDGDGIATREQDFVCDGILQRYILGTYSARRLGLETTGNSGGVFNLAVDTSDKDLDGLLQEMGTGLLVTELMGQGVNLVTGDYSRGASGFWVEAGEIQFPVERVTIAGNLKDMFMQIALIGNDVDRRGNLHTGSILIENMMVAGQ